MSYSYSEALEKARTLYREVLGITKELCRERDFERCRTLVAERGRLIVQTNELVGKPFAQSEGSVDPRVEEMQAEIRALIKESIEWDRKAQSELSRRMDTVRAELHGVKKKSRAVKCYAAQA